MNNYYIRESESYFNWEHSSYYFIDKLTEEYIIKIKYTEAGSYWSASFYDDNIYLIYCKCNFNQENNFLNKTEAICHFEKFINYYEKHLVFL